MLSQSESQIKVERLMNIKHDMNMASLLILEYQYELFATSTTPSPTPRMSELVNCQY